MKYKEENFNPKRFKEARIIRGLSIKELAIKIGVSRQAVSQYQIGESTPKQETMFRIINTLRFPKSFFYRDFEENFVGNTFFRANSTVTKKSKEIQYHKTLLAGYIYEYLSKYIEFPKLNIPKVHPKNDEWEDESIENLAREVRKCWGLGESPIPNVIHHIEKNGIIVFSVDTDSKKVDAFAQHRKGRPYIFVGNDKESAFRRQFDAAHELGHILMHKDIDNQDLLTKEELKSMEYEANKFASAFLLPVNAFKKTVTSTSLLHFIELKKYWHVSMASMIFRSLDLGIINESRYTSLQKQISMKKYRKREPLDDVYPLKRPTVIRKSIEMLINNKVKNELELVHELSLPVDLINMLCDLEEDTLNYNFSEPSVTLLKSSKSRC